ncbi:MULTISPECIES: spore germination protein [unclassified Bacillus cereus group]|uniref:spore germination protein n=1 Tax=unclassified Bacillus cereus group TaxID=2750818 RepID=UPI001F5AB804|nr:MULTISPECIES: spore germination protein [unclassified Bacillus cereus group]
MPSVIDGVIIENCNGTFNLGDKYNIQPIAMDKGYHGSGSSSVGNTCTIFNGVNVTNVNDSDKNDESIGFTL